MKKLTAAQFEKFSGEYLEDLHINIVAIIRNMKTSLEYINSTEAAAHAIQTLLLSMVSTELVALLVAYSPEDRVRMLDHVLEQITSMEKFLEIKNLNT